MVFAREKKVELAYYYHWDASGIISNPKVSANMKMRPAILTYSRSLSYFYVYIPIKGMIESLSLI